MNSFRDYLEHQYDLRKTRNPRYSLRAFANTVGMSPAQLSQMLSGKRTITAESIHKIGQKLGLSPSEKREFLKHELLDPVQDRKTQQLSEDQFALIADWFHLAILSLCHLSKAKKEPVWISQKLGISAAQAKEALSRLERLSLIDEGKKLQQKSPLLSIVSDVPSPAIQKFHRQVLHLADEKLSQVVPDKRDYSAITFNLAPKNFKKAQDLIEKFQNELSELLASDQDSEVYMLSCQFFPLTSQIQGDPE